MCSWWLALAIALPGINFLLVVFNLFTWSRGSSAGASLANLSVCIPARNEADNIEACLRSVLSAGPQPIEILVYDDHSTDGTRQILSRLEAEIPELVVIDGPPLPPGWVGKPHACHRLAARARGDHLLFLDADTRLTSEAFARLASLAEAFSAGVVSAVPRQEMKSFFERLLLPLLHLTYLAWFPLILVPKSRDPRFLAANGQLLLVSRAAYDAIGGFEAVRSEVVDDVAFCRRAKEVGVTVAFADGFRIAHCRMYGSAAETWRGFSKNIYEGIGGRPFNLIVVSLLYLTAFVAPYLMFGIAGLRTAAFVGVGLNISSRLLLLLRFRHPIEGLVLHPFAVLALLGILLNSYRWSRRGEILWRDRSYTERAARLESGK